MTTVSSDQPEVQSRKITAFLWFDGQAEEAVNFYLALFPAAKKGPVSRYGEGTPGKAGQVMTVSFELFGMSFTALNGGPQFVFTPAISFVIPCEDQAEIDRYWDALGEGGIMMQCGWLTDKFGVTWQIVPRNLGQLLSSPDPAVAGRVIKALMGMKKIKIAALSGARDEAS